MKKFNLIEQLTRNFFDFLQRNEYPRDAPPSTQVGPHSEKVHCHRHFVENLVSRWRKLLFRRRFTAIFRAQSSPPRLRLLPPPKSPIACSSVKKKKTTEKGLFNPYRIALLGFYQTRTKIHEQKGCFPLIGPPVNSSAWT